MQGVVLMEVFQGLGSLIEELKRLCFTQSLLFPNITEKIPVWGVFKHHHQLFLLLAVIVQTDNVGMSETGMDFDLPVHTEKVIFLQLIGVNLRGGVTFNMTKYE